MEPERRVTLALKRLDLPAGTLLAAVSGGADSTALLLLLVATLTPERVAVAHLDHGLRKSSREDARFVTELAARLGVPAIVKRRVVKARDGESLEDAARRARYRFLAESAAALSCTAVATAHHMDDQAETLLYRIATGTGIAGLRGIHSRVDALPLVGTSATLPPLLRPLLSFRASELRAYLTSRGETWCEDETNAAGNVADNVRAGIRSRALPALSETFGRDVVPVIARLAEQAWPISDNAEGLRSVAAALLTHRHAGGVLLPRTAAQLPPPLLRAVLEAALLSVAHRVPTAAETKRLTQCLANGVGASIRGVDVTLAAGTEPADALHLGPANEARQDPPLPVVRVTRAEAGNSVFLARLRAAPHTAEIFDAEQVTLPLSVQFPSLGMRFEPLGATGGPQRLAHYLQRHGIAREQRRRTPIVLDGDGQALWVIGHGIAKRAAVTPATRFVLFVELV